MRPIGLYVHVPFCHTRCSYCAFYSRGQIREEEVQGYLQALEVEARSLTERYPGLVFDTLFLGGGTPTALGPVALDRLLDILFRHFRFASALEFTAEANPESVSPEVLRVLRAWGCNRLSLGVQSAHADELEFLGRIHGVEEAKRAVWLARKVGLENLNLDLIFGLPGQGKRRWEATLRWALSLEPSHLSTYSLTVEPRTPLARWVRTGRVRLPSEDRVAQLFEIRERVLSEAGFRRYEISNYARPGFECRHNLIYWFHQSYLGLGPSASSFLREGEHSGLRWTNRPDLRGYIKRGRRGLPPERSEEERVEGESFLLEEVFLRLRTRWGYPVAALTPPLECLLQDLRGYLVWEEGRLVLTPRGVLVADRVALEVFEALTRKEEVAM